VPRPPRPQASPSGQPLKGAAGGQRLGLAGESSLRQRLQARDEQALVELIDLASPWLLAVAQAMLSDPEEAEEVVLETFAVAWDRIGEAGGQHDALMPWLLQITRNRAIDRLRRRRRWRVKLDRAAAYGAVGAPTVPEAKLDESARPGWHVHDSVHAALAALPSEQLDAVRLAYFQGLTHSEIARELDIPIGTVKTRLRLAFDKLRVALAPIKDWVI
jgi:RNA polymerase sigma-70 factor, ECF subfamily